MLFAILLIVSKSQQRAKMASDRSSVPVLTLQTERVVAVVTLLAHLHAQPKFKAQPKRQVLNTKPGEVQFAENDEETCMAYIDSGHFKMSVLVDWTMGHGRAAYLLFCLT